MIRHTGYILPKVINDMPRGPEKSKELRDYIYDHYVMFHESQRAITRELNEDSKLKARFGPVDLSSVHYHVAKIRVDLENSLDFDALERYTAEYVRFQHSIETEIEDIERIIKLIDMDKEKEMWLKFKRHKKDLMETKLRALQDHELPLTVRKLKRERDNKNKMLKVVEMPISDIDNNKHILHSGGEVLST